MKTLITGATGFIGTHLIKALVNEGRDVRCLTRTPGNIDKIECLGAEAFVGDLLFSDSLSSALKDVNIIYHLAGEVYTNNVQTYYKTNIQGTKNLIESSINNSSIKKFIFFSSIAAMGPCRNNTTLNEEISCNPISPYGRSKLECEKLISHFSERHKLPIVIIRPPLVYGPGINESSRALKLIQTIKKGKIIIPGDGTHRISLCYITNLIQGTLLAEKKASVIGEKFILADDGSYTYNNIIDIIAAELGITLSKTYLPHKFIKTSLESLKYLRTFLGLSDSVNLARLQEGIFPWDCDITKAKKELGYMPSIALLEGFKLTLNWCQQNNLTT
jgi:nucleoside-diphosphate-sugar epimerase